MSLETVFKPLRDLNDVLVSGRLSFTNPYFVSALSPQNRSPYELEELRAQFIFKCMKGFVLFMVGFFFLFLYYCLFGFVMGFIQESGGHSNPGAQKSAAAVKQENTDRSEAAADVDEAPQTPTRSNGGKNGKKTNGSKKSGRKG